MGADRASLAIIGTVAALLQLLLSPALTFGDATPSFIVVAVVGVIILFPDERHYVFAFVMGMIADLFSQAPVGSMAFCLVACTFLLPMAVETVGNDNFIMSLLLILVGMFAIQIVFCLFLTVSGIVGFVDGLAQVELPCVLYNTVLALIMYVIAFRFTRGRADRGSGVTMSNIRFH